MKDLNLKAQLYQASAYNGKSISLDYYRGHPHYCFHYHPEFELVLTRGSAGKRVIGNTIQEYFRKDLVLIGPDIPHTWVSERLLTPSKKCDNIILHFTRESLGLVFLAKPELTKINHLFKAHNKLIKVRGRRIDVNWCRIKTISSPEYLVVPI